MDKLILVPIFDPNNVIRGNTIIVNRNWSDLLIFNIKYNDQIYRIQLDKPSDYSTVSICNYIRDELPQGFNILIKLETIPVMKYGQPKAEVTIIPVNMKSVTDANQLLRNYITIKSMRLISTPILFRKAIIGSTSIDNNVLVVSGLAVVNYNHILSNKGLNELIEQLNEVIDEGIDKIREYGFDITIIRKDDMEGEPIVIYT
jgi:hypothetical protein